MGYRNILPRRIGTVQPLGRILGRIVIGCGTLCRNRVQCRARRYIINGLYGFSPVLTGIALGCTFYKPNVKSFFYSLAGVVFTVFVQVGMDAFFAPVGLATLTAPFCVATWIFMLPMYKLRMSRQKSSH